MKYRIPHSDTHVEVRFPAERAEMLERRRQEVAALAQELLTVEAVVEHLRNHTGLPLWACQPQEQFGTCEWQFVRNTLDGNGWAKGGSSVRLAVAPHHPANADPTHVYYRWTHDPNDRQRRRTYHLNEASRAEGEMVAYHMSMADEWSVDGGSGSCPRDAIELPANLMAALAYIRPTEGGGNLAYMADFFAQHRLVTSGGSLMPPHGLLAPKTNR